MNITFDVKGKKIAVEYLPSGATLEDAIKAAKETGQLPPDFQANKATREQQQTVEVPVFLKTELENDETIKLT